LRKAGLFLLVGIARGGSEELVEAETLGGRVPMPGTTGGCLRDGAAAGVGDADVADVAADAAGAGVTSVGLTTGDGAVEGVGLDWKGCGEVVGGRKGCGGEL
jgi:hypothetical protein